MAVINGDSYVPKQQKIDNLFRREREGENKNRIVIGNFTKPEFEYISRWVITEKIDGMNIRVHANQNGDYLIGGKTDRANIPGDLVSHIDSKLLPTRFDGSLCQDDPDHILEVCANLGYEGYNVTLFGEGYGKGIQSGHYYQDYKGFILYDVKFTKDDGRSFFVPPAEVQVIGDSLGIPRVKLFPETTLVKVIGHVRTFLNGNQYRGGASDEEFYTPEGIVAYPPTPIYDSFGNRICFKLKTKDMERAIEA